MMKKRLMWVMVAIWISTMMLIPYAAAGRDKDPACPKVSVDAGEVWMVTETTRLAKLAIAEDATVTTEEGHSLTLTVNGVETPIAPGVYKGRVVLTPTEEIVVTYNDMGLDDTYYYRTAIYVDDGKVVSEKSVAAAVVGGKVTDSYAKNIKIRSIGDEFNGIIVSGDSQYKIRHPKIDFTGNGGNDFTGFGAAIMAEGNADVLVDRARIITNGVVRTAVWAGENSIIEVNDSYIEANDGTLPDDYLGGPFAGGGVMMEVPWMLGITGNSRATNALGNSTVYYNNTHIKAQAWGALSTDAVQDVKLYATDCLIETEESGYGAYADGNSLDTFIGCTMNVADMGLIMTAGSGVFTDGTVVNSGRFGVMMHGGGSGTLTIEDGSVFNTEAAVIQVKGNYPTITVDNAKLRSASGVILESFANDDPLGGPAGTGEPVEPTDPSVKAGFSNMVLKGDIINGNTADSDVVVTFENATIKGAITTATTQRLAEDLTTEDAEFYYLIGEVVHTYGLPETDDAYGMLVSLDEDSQWIVTATSYLTALNIAEGAVVAAPRRKRVSMTIDGVATDIAPGLYEGDIVITVSKSAT
jgi:hypothetical protein